MESSLESIPEGRSSNTIFFWEMKGSDSRVDSWPLMGSPVPVFLIMTAYFLFITVGPRLMKNRSPFKLDKVLLYYNGIQVSCAALLSFLIVEKGIFKNGFLLGGCHIPKNTHEILILMGTYFYFITKISELFDTIFFVLRKKNNQITFLHVYHHSTMVVYMWSYLKFAPGGDGAVLAFLNSLVHVVMYTYYLLAGMGPSFQKYLWWKKYVTELQLVQFILMLVYLTYTHFSSKCRFSTPFNGFIFTNITIYMVLFIHFYYNQYKNNKAKLEK